MIKVLHVKQDCFGCPSAWSGLTSDGQEIYARYRWGFLRVRLGEEVIYAEQLRDDPPEPDSHWEEMVKQGWSQESVDKMRESDKVLRRFCAEHGEKGFSYHGIMDYEELKDRTKHLIEWPEDMTA